MTDRPIIFSGPMVRALLAGRKTQTRRLATSPLARCAAGDRLYVREAWRTAEAYDDLKPSDLGGEEGIWWSADRASARHLGSKPGRLRPSLHMPRWASRLTLIVEAVRVEPLQAISEEDILAEGVDPATGQIKAFYGEWRDGKMVQSIERRTCLPAWKALWSTLHTKPGERWKDNPAVVALTFRVLRGNIDEVES